MTKIAIFSDVHGNLPACEAVLRDIEAQKADKIFCLGDFIGKGPSVNEVLDLCRKHCDASVLGNWEDYLFYGPPDELPIQWYRNVIRQDHMAYLSSLGYSIEFYVSGHLVRLFHAHPSNVYYRVFPFSPPELLDQLFGFNEEDPFCSCQIADIAGYGDIHNAYMLNRKHRLIFNVGSVGVGHDSPMATYALLEGHYGDSSDKKEYQLSLRRVPYDKDKAMEDAMNSAVPFKEFYLREIRTSSFPGREPYKSEKSNEK